MTSRVYKTAQGKTLDLGQLVLQNEHTRAVGNMNVNARGDRLNSDNQVIETKNRRVQNQHQKQVASNVTSGMVHTSNIHAREEKNKDSSEDINSDSTIIDDVSIDNTADVTAPETESNNTKPRGGLAAAIARSKTVVQEKEKTPQQLQKQSGISRI